MDTIRAKEREDLPEAASVAAAMIVSSKIFCLFSFEVRWNSTAAISSSSFKSSSVSGADESVERIKCA